MGGLKRLLAGDKGIVAIAVIAFGLFVMVHATSYELGTMRRMGPGMFPLLLGGALCAAALLVLLEPSPPAERPDEMPPESAGRIRAIGFILGGILAFVLLIRTAGFIPAVAVCMLLAGAATSENRPATLLALTAVVTTLAVLVFVVGLGVPVRLVNL